MLRWQSSSSVMTWAQQKVRLASRSLHSPSLVRRYFPSPPSASQCQEKQHTCKRLGATKTYSTVTFDEAPAYQQDNPFIRTGYRVNFSCGLCLMSLFKLHNQTCNVWSHLLGVPIFVGLILFTMTTVAPAADSTTTAMFVLFLTCAILSMLTSSCYHLFQCHSEKAWLRLLQIDLSGMSFLMAGSSYPSVWIIFGNGCHGQTGVLYLAAVTLICSVGVIGPLWAPFNTPLYRRTRVVIYSGMGLSSLVPLFHLPFVFPASTILPIIVLVGLAFSFFGLGVWFYASKFPEKKWPGQFDVWFHSHTNWHICCLLGSVQVFVTAYYCFAQRHLFATCQTILV
jgi:channel protein (hemolysin III family)